MQGPHSVAQFQKWMNFLRCVPCLWCLPRCLEEQPIGMCAWRAGPVSLHQLPLTSRRLPAASPSCSTATSEEHQLAYEQFRGVSVWRRGMDVRVPLTDLLASAPPPP